MALIVSDANIFIDLDFAGLTARMFRMDLDVVVPDLLYESELSSQHSELPGLGLQVRELPSALIREADDLGPDHPRLSANDRFAFVLARAENCPLLTGDKALRRFAEGEGLHVYGTIWLMEQLFNSDLVSLDELTAAYEQMRNAQRRLPEREITQQLRKLAARER